MTPRIEHLAEGRALEIWRERERQFPAFVRRMNPDELDRATGAWSLVLAQAQSELSTEPDLFERPAPAKQEAML